MRRWTGGGCVAGMAAGAALGLYAHAKPDANVLTTALNAAVGRTAAEAIGGQWYEYDPKFFKEDLDAGKTLLVAVHAEWCPTCAAQTPSITSACRWRFSNNTHVDPR